MGSSLRDAVELPRRAGQPERPRCLVRAFRKLPPAQQQAILRAALDEFAAHGFHDASLNRIIDAAGHLQGLDVLLLRRQGGPVRARRARRARAPVRPRSGPVPVPTAPRAGRLLVDAGGLLPAASWPRWRRRRSWRRSRAVGSRPRPARPSQQAQKEMEQRSCPWFEQALAAGQRARRRAHRPAGGPADRRRRSAWARRWTPG